MTRQTADTLAGEMEDDRARLRSVVDRLRQSREVLNKIDRKSTRLNSSHVD